MTEAHHKRQRASKGGGRPSAQARRFRPLPAHSISQAEAQELMPPGAHIWKDLRENRFRCVYKPYGSASRSWTVYGEMNAFKKAVALI
jgi:hypothetical protein